MSNTPATPPKSAPVTSADTLPLKQPTSSAADVPPPVRRLNERQLAYVGFLLRVENPKLFEALCVSGQEGLDFLAVPK